LINDLYLIFFETGSVVCIYIWRYLSTSFSCNHTRHI